MGYPKEITYSALETIAQRKLKAERTAENHLNELLENFPEFRKIHEDIASTGVRAAKAVFAKGNAKEVLNHLMQENLQNQEKIKKFLISQGLPENYLSTVYFCEKCSDTGYFQKKLCTCTLEEAKKLAVKSLNQKSPLAFSSFSSFDLDYYAEETDASRGVSPKVRMEKILRFCKNYAESFSETSQNLLFMGATGLGKTHLSLAIAAELTDKNFGVVYGSAQDLLHSIEKEHFGRGEKGTDTLELILTCDLLILDDLGTEFTSPFIQSTVYNIINTRMLERRPMIINTNLSMSEIRSVYHERIVSRLVGGYTIHEFIGKDVRFLKKTKRKG